MTENTEKFTGRADAYSAARPDYADGLFEHLMASGLVGKEAVIADIGSGTGKFAHRLLQTGATVLCVEPNRDMRLAAEAALAAYPNFTSIAGTAEATGIESGTVSCVTVAQAFHWFDPAPFRKECERILRPGGQVALVWNFSTQGAPLVQENAQICQAFCPNFKGFSGGDSNLPAKLEAFFGGSYKTLRFANNLHYTREKFLQRMRSASYSLQPEDFAYPAFMRMLEKLFEKYASDGILTLPNDTVAYIGQIS